MKLVIKDILDGKIALPSDAGNIWLELEQRREGGNIVLDFDGIMCCHDNFIESLLYFIGQPAINEGIVRFENVDSRFDYILGGSYSRLFKGALPGDILVDEDFVLEEAEL